MSCAICEMRKEKRFCPAVHGRICPQCCGEQREVTLDCPSDCPYLQQAREHEKPRSTADLDPAAVFLQVELGDQFLYEHEHLIMGLSYALAKAVRRDRALHDRDLIAALTALARGYGVTGREKATRITFRYAWPSETPTESQDGIRVRTGTLRLGENPALAGLKRLNLNVNSVRDAGAESADTERLIQSMKTFSAGPRNWWREYTQPMRR